MTFEVILNFMKKLCLHNFDIHEKFLKDSELNQKNIAEKDDFVNLKMTFCDLL